MGFFVVGKSLCGRYTAFFVFDSDVLFGAFSTSKKNALRLLGKLKNAHSLSFGLWTSVQNRLTYLYPAAAYIRFLLTGSQSRPKNRVNPKVSGF